jgi:Domain of unknown function (DUF4388)
LAAKRLICDNGLAGSRVPAIYRRPMRGAPLRQATLELPTEEIALQCWLVMQQGGLVIPILDVAFEAQVDVEIAFGFCPHRYELQGTVVSATPHGTALQLAPIPDPVRQFFVALEQGEEPPDPPLQPPSRTSRLASKLKGDFWSTMDEFSEVMLEGDPDEAFGDLEESAESFDESQSVICEIHDSSSLELPAELLASLELPGPPPPATAETEEANRATVLGDSLETSANMAESSEYLEPSATLGQLTGDEGVFEGLAKTLLGLDSDDMEENSDDLDAEIDAMLHEVRREDTLTEMAEPSVEYGEPWTAVPWTRKADRNGSVNRGGTGTLIKELTSSRDTGILRMDMPDRTVYSLWLAGNPTFVTADPPEEGGELEHALASFPLVDHTVFEQALKKSAEQDRHLALVLIDVGILQDEDVRDLMHLMARRAVRMFPMLKKGRYHFWECAVPMTDEGLELDLEQVLAWEPGVSPPSEDSLL